MQYLRVGNANNSSSANFGTSVKYNTSGYTQKYRFNLNVSVFPFLAYKKFCQDYFRYSQWQDSSPYLWNIDYYTGSQQLLFSSIPSASDAYWQNNTMFDLEYCNWNKDLFMGVLPDTQFGDVATVGVSTESGSFSSEVYLQSISGTGPTVRPVETYAAINGSNSHTEITISDPNTANIAASSPLLARIDSASLASSFDVLALRRGEALQRWKEISLNVPQNYRAQIKAHFGVDVGENMSGMSTYIGGDSSSLDISEVVNTNLQSGDSQSEAVIAGKGVGSSQGSEKFEDRD